MRISVPSLPSATPRDYRTLVLSTLLASARSMLRLNSKRTVRRVSVAPQLALVFGVSTTAHAQDLEPRAYSNSPIGLNFAIAGYAYATGMCSRIRLYRWRM